MRLLLPVGGLGRGSVFWKRQFAVPTIPGILVVELPTPAMTAFVKGSSDACPQLAGYRLLSEVQWAGVG